MFAIRFISVILFCAIFCAGCRTDMKPKSAQSAVPEIPQVSDQVLRQQLFTLREMAQEHSKLSSLAIDSEKNEKTEHRLKLLREGFAYLQKKCRTEFKGNGSDQEIVNQFLDQCLNAMR